MHTDLTIRSVAPQDFAAWQSLWDGYNTFYGRSGATALPPAITHTTWSRFFDPMSQCTRWSPSVRAFSCTTRSCEPAMVRVNGYVSPQRDGAATIHAS